MIRGQKRQRIGIALQEDIEQIINKVGTSSSSAAAAAAGDEFEILKNRWKARTRLSGWPGKGR